LASHGFSTCVKEQIDGHEQGDSRDFPWVLLFSRADLDEPEPDDSRFRLLPAFSPEGIVRGCVPYLARQRVRADRGNSSAVASADSPPEGGAAHLRGLTAAAPIAGLAPFGVGRRYFGPDWPCRPPPAL
jgi:hypothetical protein